MTLLEPTSVSIRELSPLDRATLLALMLAPLSDFSEERAGMTVGNLDLAVRQGTLERTPERARWIAANRLLGFIEAGSDLTGNPEYGFAATDQWVLQSAMAGEIGGGAALDLMAAVHWPSDGRTNATPQHWYFRAWMTDTGMPIFVYDNFSGPLVRWDYSAGEVAKTSEFGAASTPPEPEQLVSEIRAVAEERRLL